MSDLAPFVLRSAYENKSGLGHLHLASATRQLFESHDLALEQRFPRQKYTEIETAINAAWHWMIRQGIIIPAPGYNGQNGWMVLTQEGEEFLNTEDGFNQYAQASAIPKSMYHPSIADDVWRAILRGGLDEAVLIALRQVEIAVREAGKYSDKEVGKDLMRLAFKTNTGPLTDKSLLPAEQEGFSNLFAGAMGAYKNAQSHRAVKIKDAQQAQEIALLASHLLRIVDARRKP